MNSTSEKNKNLDFTRDEKISKNNIDYFNLKEDRANEEKKEKFQNFVFVSVAALSVIAFVRPLSVFDNTVVYIERSLAHRDDNSGQ